MRTVRNHNSHAKEYSPQSSSSIRFSPRGDAFKHPVQHYDVAKVRSVSEALEAFNATSFQSRKLGQSYKIWLKMLNDPERPMIFFGISGAMIPGGMRRIIRDLIAFNAIDVLVSTGANLSHDLYESLGGRHYMAHHHIDDPTLREMRIDRVYDTYADDVKFTEADQFVEKFAETLEPRSYSSREIFQLMGERIRDDYGILATAARERLPVFVPALADSSIGMALTVYKNEKMKRNAPPAIYDALMDNIEIMGLTPVPQVGSHIHRGRHSEELHPAGRPDGGDSRLARAASRVRDTGDDRRSQVWRTLWLRAAREPVVGKAPSQRGAVHRPRGRDYRPTTTLHRNHGAL